MKNRILTLLCCIAVCLPSIAAPGDYAALPKNSNELKVAVYDNGIESKEFAINHIYDALKNATGVEAELIDNLASDTLKKYDAVVICTVTKPAPKDFSDTDRGIKGTDWIKTLTNYVDCGGGLIIGHNAIGLRGIFSTYKLFPMVGTTCSRNLDANYIVKDASHPVMSGIPPKFNHQYDHMEIMAGKNGQVLAVDKFDKGVVVAGDVSRGRIVQIGFPMGVYWQGKTGELTNTDKMLLLNSVKWAGAKPRYDVPMKATETGLLAETMNYKKQQDEIMLAKYKDLPAPKFDEAVAWAPSYWIGPGAMMDSKEKIITVMDNYKRMGFNKIAIIAKFGVYYYPTGLNTDEKMEGCREGFSYTGCMIEEARKRGMKISLILCPFLSSQEWDKYAPDISREEYEKIQQGKMQTADIDADRKWARRNCPDHPAVRARALKITEELINRYHPDELYLDYIRYKDGYDTSCFCDYSLKQKAKFAAEHPDFSKDMIDKKFAEESLVSFVVEWNKLCKKMDPDIKTACYTISAPGCKAPGWVNKYPLDWHSKYVSRHTNGPESSLDDTAALAQSYSKWMKSGAAGSQFSPMIATYDPKSGERLFTEFKIISDFQDKDSVKFKRVEFYEYGQLLESPKKDFRISADMAGGISHALGGSWDKQQR
ncbi:MAG: ThuA domain-containing protein [Victivallaceae bacterium]|jgi:hypothetical protein